MCLSISIPVFSQFQIAPNGKAFFGEFTDSQLNSSFSWNINRYRGTLWQLKKADDANMHFFGIEMGEDATSMFGSGDKVVFYNNDNLYMNSIVVARMYQLLSNASATNYPRQHSLEDISELRRQLEADTSRLSLAGRLSADTAAAAPNGGEGVGRHFFDRGNAVSCLTSAAQVIQGKLAVLKDAMQRMQNNAETEDLTYVVRKGHKVTINCFNSQDAAECTVLITTMNGIPVKTVPFKGTGYQTVFADTDDMKPGTYRYAGIIGNQIGNTGCFVVSE